MRDGSFEARLIAMTLALCGSAGASDVVPGPVEIQVNTERSGDQDEPAVAVSEDGLVLVAWESDAHDRELGLALLDTTLRPVGAELSSAIPARAPALAALPDGRFVLVAQEVVGERWTHDIVAMHVDAGGRVSRPAPISPAWLPGLESDPVVASGPSGDALVAWETGGCITVDGTSCSGSVLLRGYARFGFPWGLRHSAETTRGFYRSPSIASRSDGHFQLVWVSGIRSDRALRTRSVGPFGSAPGPVRVVASAIQPTFRIDVAVNDAGDMLVARDALGADRDPDVAYARLLDRDGDPIAPELTLGAGRPGEHRAPAATALADGFFAIVWEWDPDPAGPDAGELLGLLVSPAGIAASQPFAVNAATLDDQIQPAIAALPAGGFVVAWASERSPGDDADGRAVLARVFDVR